MGYYELETHDKMYTLICESCLAMKRFDISKDSTKNVGVQMLEIFLVVAKV